MGERAWKIAAGRWSRREFLAAAAASAALMAAGAGEEGPSPGGAAGPGTCPVASGTAAGSAAPDLLLHGSPYLLSTSMPPASALTSPEGAVGPIVHFHLPDDLRDRLVLGLP